MVKYQSFGAAKQVTGSMHLLEFDANYKVLLDCGLDYERNEFGESKSNLTFPFNPAEIDVLILSHAHIDHSGNIPNLVRQGFTGKIFCTKATAFLLNDLWKDSLQIQLSENRKEGNKKGRAKSEILYNERHIALAINQINAINYKEEIFLTPAISFQFVQAGHIIGAASIRIQDIKGNVTIGFTGDLGNYNTQLVVNPNPMQGLDYLISESTYGGRAHSADSDAKAMLMNYINEVCVKGRGKLVIPAFSIGRTQAIIYTFHQIYRDGNMPEWLKIYTDSPLAIKSTKVYEHFNMELNQNAKDFYSKYNDLFDFPNLKTVSEPAESDYISQSYEPCVIVSAAGMMEGGRIQKHIRHNVQWPDNAILIAGYCAEGTMGARLLSGQKKITINKKEKPVLAKIYRTDAFSAHADVNGLLDYYEGTKISAIKKLFLVHGDEESMKALSEKVVEKFKGVEVILPNRGEIFLLNQ